MKRWLTSAGVALIGLLGSGLLVASYALGEWPLAVRIAAEVLAAAALLVGVLWLWRGVVIRRSAGWLIGWSMVALALCSSEPSAVAGGLLLAATFAMLTLATTPNHRNPPRSGDVAALWLLLPLPPGVGSIGLWLYLHAAMARGEWLYAALMLLGVAGLAFALLRLRPHVGWTSKVLAGISFAGFVAGSLLVDNLLRPLLAALAGLPAWSALRVQRLDLPAPQPNAAVGFALQVGSDTNLLPMLVLVMAFAFALALAWLLYRLLVLVAALGRHDG